MRKAHFALTAPNSGGNRLAVTQATPALKNSPRLTLHAYHLPADQVNEQSGEPKDI